MKVGLKQCVCILTAFYLHGSCQSSAYSPRKLVYTQWVDNHKRPVKCKFQWSSLSLYLLEELPTPSCPSVFSIVFLSVCSWICSSFICTSVFPEFPSSVHQLSLCEEGETTMPQCSGGPWSHVFLIPCKQKLSRGIAWPDLCFWGLTPTVLHECDKCGEDRNGE